MSTNDKIALTFAFYMVSLALVFYMGFNTDHNVPPKVNHDALNCPDVQFQLVEVLVCDVPDFGKCERDLTIADDGKVTKQVMFDCEVGHFEPDVKLDE